MNELRWHPILRQWVAVASARQDRPQMPKDWCPFDPGSGRVPDQYDVLIYPNDFPAFSFQNAPYEPQHEIFATTGAQGSCDVVIYSPDHNLSPSKLSAEQWLKVVNVWTTRCHELTQHEVVQYIAVFENTGEAIGVTMPHPHGQIYAFPFIPPFAETELAATSEHFEKTGACLYCEVLKAELEAGVRIIAQNEKFVAFVPFSARFPSEVQIYSRRHVASLQELEDEERPALASLISIVRQKLDNLYQIHMPLMMVLRQAPTHGTHPYFHFHMELLPIQRSKTKLKYLAAVETTCGTFLADTTPEDKARELREADPKTNG